MSVEENGQIFVSR